VADLLETLLEALRTYEDGALMTPTQHDAWVLAYTPGPLRKPLLAALSKATTRQKQALARLRKAGLIGPEARPLAMLAQCERRLVADTERIRQAQILQAQYAEWANEPRPTAPTDDPSRPRFYSTHRRAAYLESCEWDQTIRSEPGPDEWDDWAAALYESDGGRQELDFSHG
jgi:hypothetical protein